MGNRHACCGSARVHAREAVKLLVVGLDDAGKTSICHVLQGKPSSTLVPSPTVGFNAPVEVTIHGCSVVVYDVGGSKGIRAIWPEYLAEAHALVFVVDSAAPARFDDAADALESLVEHRYGAGKSVLVLANKADLASAAPAADITDHLRERGHAPRLRVQSCSAVAGDRCAVRAAVAALVQEVRTSFAELDKRVRQDHSEHTAAERKRRSERLAEGRAAREKRQADAVSVKDAMGATAEPHEPGADCTSAG